MNRMLLWMEDFLGPRVKPQELAVFTRQLWTLQKAGIPLLSSLVSLRDQTRTPAFKKTLSGVIKEVESGAPFSAALSAHPTVFKALYFNMVKAGEASGKLDEVLLHLAQMLEFEVKTADKIRSAMLYPAVTFAALVAAFIAIVTVVMPKFIDMYARFHAQLPLPSRILLGINDAVRYHGPELVVGIAAIVFIFRYLTSLSQGRYLWDNFRIHFPVLGPLIMNVDMSRFAKILSELLSSGVPILQALRLVSDTVDNALIQRAILRISASVNEGRGMAEPMASAGFFTPMVVQMVAVGEMSGKTDELLAHAAEYYREHVENMTKNLSSLLEPLLICFMGGLVLLLALGVFLPIWQLVYVVH